MELLLETFHLGSSVGTFAPERSLETFTRKVSLGNLRLGTLNWAKDFNSETSAWELLLGVENSA